MKTRALTKHLVMCGVASMTLLALAGSAAHADRVYTPVLGSNEIEVFDTTKSWTKLQEPIAFSGESFRGTAVGLSPDGDRLYAAAITGDINNLFAFDADTGEQVAVRPTTGVAPTSLAVSPDGKRVYVTDGLMPYVSGYGTGLGLPRAVIETGLFGQTDIAVSPDGRYLYVVAFPMEEIAVVDLQTKPATVTKVDVNGGAAQVAISQPDASGDTYAYVSFPWRGEVAAIHVDEDPDVDRTYRVGDGWWGPEGLPTRIAVHPKTGRVYVGQPWESKLTVLPDAESEDLPGGHDDEEEEEEAETIELDGTPSVLGIAGDGEEGYVVYLPSGENPLFRTMEVEVGAPREHEFLNAGVSLPGTPLDIAVEANPGDYVKPEMPGPKVPDWLDSDWPLPGDWWDRHQSQLP